MDKNGYKKFLEAKEALKEKVQRIERRKRLISLAIGNPEKSVDDAEFISEEIEFLKEDEFKIKHLKELVEIIGAAYAREGAESSSFDDFPFPGKL